MFGRAHEPRSDGDPFVGEASLSEGVLHRDVLGPGVVDPPADDAPQAQDLGVLPGAAYGAHAMSLRARLLSDDEWRELTPCPHAG